MLYLPNSCINFPKHDYYAINFELIVSSIAATLFVGSQPLFGGEIRPAGSTKAIFNRHIRTTSDCCSSLLVAKSKGPSANPGGTKNDEKSNELLKNSPKKARVYYQKLRSGVIVQSDN